MRSELRREFNSAIENAVPELARQVLECVLDEHATRDEDLFNIDDLVRSGPTEFKMIRQYLRVREERLIRVVAKLIRDAARLELERASLG